MASNPNQESNPYYRGYTPQQTSPSYDENEMPQSDYPQGYAPPPTSPSYDQSEMPQSDYPQRYPPDPPPLPGGSYPYQQQQQYEYRPPQSQYRYIQANAVELTQVTGMGLKARTAGWLSYLFGWVTGLIFFLLEKDNHFVRFHAMQSILFFGSLSILQGALSSVAFLSGVPGLIMFIGWIILILNARKGRYYKLPILGNLAEQLERQIR